MLNGTNFKACKEVVEIILGYMDLDLALWAEKPTPNPKNPNEDKVEKWEHSNRMCLMTMKRSVPEVFRGSISESHNAKGFHDAIEHYFTSNEKADASSFLAKLISMRYKGKGNIREYIMEMSNLVSKLKALKLELSDDLLVHLVLISLPTHFGQFKVSYNTQKDKWTLNELISHCVQEKERQQREKTESAHLASSSQNRKRKNNKDVVERTSQQKKVKKDENIPTFFFCKKPGHMKKEYPKYASWHVKKGNFLSFIFFEVNLAFVPHDTWWVDFGATTHINVSMQGCLWSGPPSDNERFIGCLWSRPPSDNERFIYVGDGNKVTVEAIGTFRLQLKTGFHLDLFETFVVPSFRRNLISISSLDKFGFSCSFGNNKFRLYQNSNVVGSGSLIDNLYLLDVVSCNKEIFYIDSRGMKCKINENFATLWHKRLGHISK
uniref:Retrovirus-related Pol polyprotein from transposon TNT 1-94 n=1 Tax=Cajanus cajan TaxID=3821 RepID=A0A151QMM9_CAJCA|nr:Retrovirus-related Pol polyprotein from transposon TNT 1-94 [Cajanus cajan]